VEVSAVSDYPLCAVCGRDVYLEDKHVKVEAEELPRTEFANMDSYWFHERCWRSVSKGWFQP
jgi:hypothetical protein